MPSDGESECLSVSGLTESEPLRPCPFCAHERPTLAEVGTEALRFVAVTCPECGAIGPRATSDDAQGTAKHLWNARYGGQ